jgi:acyl-CoA synthetase (AMP-forming)/AMP-acid ligase II
MNNWFDHILFHLRTRGERPAMVMEDRVVTYEMLRVAVDRCARRLVALGITGDQPVAILVENQIRHVTLCLALLRIGIPAISLEPSQPGIGSMRFAAVLGDDKAKSLADPINRFIDIIDDWFSADPGGPPLPAGFSDADQVCRVFLTSGTTGQPKFFNVTIKQLGVRIAGFTGGNWSSLLCLPGLSSGWTFNALGAALSNGQTLCFATSPMQAIRMIELFSIDYLVASTEQLLALTFVARKTGASLRALRMVEVSGSVPTAVLLKAAMIHVCRDVFCRYGTTELGPIARAAARDVLLRPGFAGHLLPGAEISIVDRHNAPCTPGVVGQINARQDLRLDAAARRDPGKNQWIDVGDLGWMSDDDELYVLGRPADLSSTAAVNAPTAEISPVHEVEHLLRLEWGAADAAAVLVDDAHDSSRQIMWVGAVDCKDADADKLQAIVRAAGLDLPVRLFAIKFVPRGTNGKVQRAQLKSMMTEATALRGNTPA